MLIVNILDLFLWRYQQFRFWAFRDGRMNLPAIGTRFLTKILRGLLIRFFEIQILKIKTKIR
jgi:hypothetical protein